MLCGYQYVNLVRVEGRYYLQQYLVRSNTSVSSSTLVQHEVIDLT